MIKIYDVRNPEHQKIYFERYRTPMVHPWSVLGYWNGEYDNKRYATEISALVDALYIAYGHKFGSRSMIETFSFVKPYLKGKQDA